MLVLALANVLDRDALLMASFMLFFLPLSYLPGFAPAILTCQADDYFADKLSLQPRMAITSLVGGIVVVAWCFFISWSTWTISWSTWTEFQLASLGAFSIGAVPAAVCSWLADRWE